jgi:hypothetical protein
MEWAIVVAVVQVEAKSRRVVRVAEMSVAELVEVALVADLERALLLWAASMEAVTPMASVEMQIHLVESLLCEPDISSLIVIQYLRNDAPPCRTRISHDTRLSTSYSANFSHELSK